ncbi:MAG TPA: thioredoxin domain-containing protein [Isosphaeraceae bacterium]|nr:thioredoxin domain-containing protein [Isosphaeraceae bacterium]
MTDPAASASRPANRLAGETSPYLLQHAHNPVDWYPWGPEAFARAKTEQKPIFLSVGYSACHWCHVMERESFENEEIAAVMNEAFVNVKVDREERPDVDQIYMAAVQAMSGHGGWPMSVFLTPDMEPFFGGTYFPPVESRGMVGFPRLLKAVAEAWQSRREEIAATAGEMAERLRAIAEVPTSDENLGYDLLDRAAQALARTFDASNGGFGPAPKFPHAMDLRLLLRQHARTRDPHALHMVVHTLDKMSRGGIYDHLDGGFARYSTDDRWLVPHFEKMLYDNALLCLTLLELYQVTHDSRWAGVARETLDYVLERMTSPEGPFYSTEDADSEGVEGKYYVWSLDEVREVLGPERAKTFSYVYDVTERGNWEHHTILNMPKPLPQAAQMLARDEEDLRAELARSRAELLAAREKRVPPGKDTKVLTSWNGLMLAPMAQAAWILGEERYLEAARRAAGFFLERMRAPGGLLLHCYKDGQAKLNGYLDDYACLVDGLLWLFETAGEPRWLEAAIELSEIMLDEFASAPGAVGGFFYTGKSHETLIARQRDVYDNATPAASAMAATALLRLGAITGREAFRAAGWATLQAAGQVMRQAPMAAAQSLIALDFALAPRREFAVVAGSQPNEFADVMRAIYNHFLPHKVVAPKPPGSVGAAAQLTPLLDERPAREGRTTTYVCVDFVCKEPIVGVEGLEPELQTGASGPAVGSGVGARPASR